MHNGAVPGSVLVFVGVAVWLAPLLIAKHGAGSLVAVDRRARWGLLLQVAGLGMMSLGGFGAVTKISWRILAAVIFLGLAALLSWTATRALGRQLRIDAAIGEEHELVHHGPYRVIRHPIYGSMLCLLWGIGFIGTPLWMFLAATAVFVAGTEIRVRIEDRLLAERFGEDFRQYQRSKPAYVPLIR